MSSMIATDLDGTLLRSDGQFSARNLETLRTLGQKGVIRVVATGRSLYSARRVLPEDLPLDYLVFSSGAGIVDWSSQTMIRALNMEPEATERACEVLLELNLDFMVHAPIPENHRFIYHAQSTGEPKRNPDFFKRVALYASHCEQRAGPWRRPACQLIAISPEDAPYREVAHRLGDYSVVRTTSPLDHRSTWIEIFPSAVSKSLGCAWLAKRCGVEASRVVAVGNDSNDLDLLAWAGRAFVVGNALAQLREAYPTVAGHDEDGFSEAAKHAL